MLTADDSNKSVIIWTKYSCASEISYLKVFQKVLWIIEFWAAFRKMSTLVDTKFNYFLQTEQF